MPNIRAAAKRVRADRKRRLKNLAVRSELKTAHRKFAEALQKGEADAAKQILQLLVKKLDQAAQKKVIPRNTASRKKSRLARQLAKRIKS
ncbi:MAG: 30S ribosomal protein S20 [Candidatus Omnitrophica bacterium]|nr:30S ribosomal protein S20 [Candidatus Omnitrophota bacterium]